MKELTDKLKSLGLSEEMAAKAITTVAGFIKSKLPEAVHPMIDEVLAGKSPDLGGTGGFIESLKGMFASK